MHTAQMSLGGKPVGCGTVFSIGYGRNSPEWLKKEMEDRNVSKLVDVRTYASGRFNKKLLKKIFGRMYRHIPELGGYNFEWVDYEDWLRKDGTKHALAQLRHLVDSDTVCIMCAESDYTQCHRKYFVARAMKDLYGVEVVHL